MEKNKDVNLINPKAAEDSKELEALLIGFLSALMAEQGVVQNNGHSDLSSKDNLDKNGSENPTNSPGLNVQNKSKGQA